LSKYYIRYNTKHGDSELVWRVIEGSHEHLVKDFLITVPMRGESTVEHGIVKWNVCCEGVLNIVNDVAYIQ
jgi:hypothetical protein